MYFLTFLHFLFNSYIQEKWEKLNPLTRSP